MRLLTIIVFLLLFLQFSPVHSYTSENCFFYTEKYGKKFNLPDKLLTSISLVESGTKKNDKFVSWPWTLNVSGKSKFFENKNDALVFLKKNFDKHKNIDVGCMQISLKYHFKEFKNLDSVLDPEKNVKYAAKFLKSLFVKHRKWNEAISRYHSSKPKKKAVYLAKVKSYWAEVRQKNIKLFNQNKSKKEKIEFFRNQFKNQINFEKS